MEFLTEDVSSKSPTNKCFHILYTMDRSSHLPSCSRAIDPAGQGGGWFSVT